MSDLAVFLFGNVDRDGRLEGSFLDLETEKALARVADRIGGKLLRDVNQDNRDSKGNTAEDEIDYERKESDAVNYETIEEVAEEELQDRMAQQRAFAAYQARRARQYETNPDDDGGLASSLDPSDPRYQARLEAAKKVEALRLAAQRGGLHFRPIVTAPRTYHWTKKDLPQLFPGYGEDKILMFSEMFAPKKENKKLPVRRKDDGNGEEGDAKSLVIERAVDEEDTFSSYIPPRPVLLRIQAPVVAMQVRETTNPLAAEATSATSATREMLQARHKPYVWNAASNEDPKSPTDPTVSQMVPDILLPNTAFMPVSQLEWENNIQWDDETDDQDDVAYGPDVTTWKDDGPSGLAGDGSASDLEMEGISPHAIAQEVQEIAEVSAALDSMFDEDDDDDDDMEDSAVARKTDKLPSIVPGPAHNPVLTAGEESTTVLREEKAKMAVVPQDGQVSDQESEEKSVSHGPSHSIFSPVNLDLIYGSWDKSIVWDDAVRPPVAPPTCLLLDMNDANLIFEDGDGPPEPPKPTNQIAEVEPEPEKKPKGKKPQEKGQKKVKLRSSREQHWTNAIRVFENQTTDVGEDFFNLSHDKAIAANRVQHTVTKTTIAHSLPAHRLMPPFFRTSYGRSFLRHWHRPSLSPLAPNEQSSVFTVTSLAKNVRKKAKEREKERQKSGGGDIFFMKNRKDLSGKKKGNDVRPKFKHGALVTLGRQDKTQHLFLGNLGEGEFIQSMENKMFRAPMYRHMPPETDFLIIRSKNKFFVREIQHIYAAGQVLPKVAVPAPNSRKANNFVRDRLAVHIYRMFKAQSDKEKRIKIEEVRAAFPNHSETSIRKKLKQCSDFKRRGNDSGWWVLKKDFRLMTEEELRATVTPEQVCAYESMCAARQRLRDAGYGTGKLLDEVLNDDDEGEAKIDDEVKLAPWNTSQNFLDAVSGKCQLAVTGVGDPTGRGEGFSFIRAPNKPVAVRHDNPIPRKKVTDDPEADLRRLPLKDAKVLLRDKFRVKEDDMPKGRWAIINMVREKSNEAAREGDGYNKFARGTRTSFAEHQQRYLAECQKVFEGQNRALASRDTQPTDSESGSEGSDLENFGQELEGCMMDNDDEILEEDNKPMTTGLDVKSDTEQPSITKLLKITRSYQSNDGTTYKRTEVVRNPKVIEMYLMASKQRGTKQFGDVTGQDQMEREESRKRKRQVKERTRKYKQPGDEDGPEGLAKRRGPRPGEGRIKRCSACGGIGHVKSNKKKCPLRRNQDAAMDHEKDDDDDEGEEDDEEEGEGESSRGTHGPDGNDVDEVDEVDDDDRLDNKLRIRDDLLKVEGTKLTISKPIVEHAASQREKLKVRLPSITASSPGPQGSTSPYLAPLQHGYPQHRQRESDDDYGELPDLCEVKRAVRRRKTPIVEVNRILEQALDLMFKYPGSDAFHCKVDTKEAPGYYDIIKKPMDLSTMRYNVRHTTYVTRFPFLDDMDLMVDNCVTYNGKFHPLVSVGMAMRRAAINYLRMVDSELMPYELESDPNYNLQRAQRA
eukprot:Ihof_evm2s16 gene=Ihof_evmTU2s16